MPHLANRASSAAVTLPTLLLIAALGSTTGLAAQSASALRGRVVEASTGRALEAAQITLLPEARSVLSDVDGGFTLGRVPAGAHTLRVLRLGYAPWEGDIRVPREGEGGPLEPLAIALTPRAEQLAGITVIGPGQGSLVRIPGSAVVVDREQLAVTRPLSGNEVFKLVPGVNVQEEEALGLRANIGVRGLDPDRSRTVLVLEDGVPVALAPYGEPEMYYTPPIDRMERVEIIKGSGSILFGPQTVGGVINYVTPEPPATPQGRVELLGGSGRFARAHLTYGGRWNGAGAQASLLRRQADHIRGLFFDQTDATVKTTLELGQRDVAGFKLSAYDENSNATYVGLTDSIFRANPTFYAAPDDRLRLQRYAVSLSHEHRFSTGSALKTAMYGYQTSRDWQRQDYAYTASGNDYVWRNSTGNRDRSFDVVGVEPRYRASHGLGEFEGGVRGHYERARDQHINGRTSTSRTGEIRDEEIRTGHAFAAFAQNRFQLSDRLRVTPGLRFEYFAYERHILRTRVGREVRDSTGAVIGATRLPEDVDLRSGDDLFALIPGIGVSWIASDRATIFAGAHRGFAPPRVKDALIYADEILPPDQQPGDPISLQLDAEKSWNLELGTRSRPLDGVSLEATLFYLDFSNQIIEPSLSAGTVAQAALANQGETSHRGFEGAVGLDWGLIARWAVSLRTELRYTYSDARFSNHRFVANGLGDTVDIKGNRLPYAPRHIAAVSATLALPDRCSLKVDGIRVSEQFADNFETRAPSANGRNGLIPAHTVWNATGMFTVPGTELQLAGTVKNLLGKTYIASRRPEGIKPGLFRHVQLGLEWRF